MGPLAVWVLNFMLSWFVYPDRVSPARVAELKEIAIATADASESVQLCGRTAVQTAAWLTNEGHLESGWSKAARGKQNEVGVWQLMPPPLGAPVPAGLEAQAREAIRRWNEQGANVFTGEGRCRELATFGICPLALNRELGGELYLVGHPYGVSSILLARQP